MLLQSMLTSVAAASTITASRQTNPAVAAALAVAVVGSVLSAAKMAAHAHSVL